MIYKSSSFQIASLAILLLVTMWGFSLPGSAEEKNSYDFSVLQRAFLQGTLASHPDIRKKIEGFLVFIYADIYRRIEDFLILGEDRVGDAIAIYTKVKYTSEWAKERSHCSSYRFFLFVKEDGQCKLYKNLFSKEKVSPYRFLPPLGTFQNTDAGWEEIPVFFRVLPEGDLPFEKVKVTFDDLYVYFRFEFKNKLTPQGEIIDGGEFPETGNFSIAFDIDNNPETPEFIRGFEREIVFFIGEGGGAKTVDGRLKKWRFRSYTYHIKKYAEGILGRCIFRTSILPINSHIIIGDKLIILRAPREHLGLKENLEVRISFRYRGRTEVSKTVVIP